MSEDHERAGTYWQCEECGHKDSNKPMPKNREKFYREGRDIKCPKCKSVGYHPVGY